MLKLNHQIFSEKNSIITETKKAKYLPNIFIVLILSYLISSNAPAIGYMLASILYGSFFQITKITYSPDYDIFIQLLSFLMTAFIIFAWVRLVERRKIKTLGFYGKHKILKICKGGIFAIILLSAIIGILYLMGYVTYSKGSDKGSLIVFILLFFGFLIQSSSEEIFSRGWQLSVLSARYNAVVGFVVSSLFFGFLHLANAGISPMAILNLILYSLFVGIYVFKTENLLQACGFHALWNYMLAIVYGMAVSGNRMAFTMVQLELKGPDLLTGGTFGVEASIISTVAFILCICYLLFKKDSGSKKATA